MSVPVICIFWSLLTVNQDHLWSYGQKSTLSFVASMTLNCDLSTFKIQPSYRGTIEGHFGLFLK